MKQISLLEDSDRIDEDTWCRPLAIQTESLYSESIFFTSAYTGTPQNHARWCEVTRIMPALIGRTVAEVNAQFSRTDLLYEFVKGDIPKIHTEALTSSEYEQTVFANVLKSSYIQCSKKHKGKTMFWIRENDPDYYRWADVKGLIPNCTIMYMDYVDEYYRS